MQTKPLILAQTRYSHWYSCGPNSCRRLAALPARSGPGRDCAEELHMPVLTHDRLDHRLGHDAQRRKQGFVPLRLWSWVSRSARGPWSPAATNGRRNAYTEDFSSIRSTTARSGGSGYTRHADWLPLELRLVGTLEDRARRVRSHRPNHTPCAVSSDTRPSGHRPTRPVN